MMTKFLLIAGTLKEGIVISVKYGKVGGAAKMHAGDVPVDFSGTNRS